MSKKSIVKISIFALLIVSVFAIGTQITKNKKPPETKYISASYAFDINDLRKLVGCCSNVFVGYVEEMTGTSYDASLPRTCYDVTVVDNIKGELPLDSVVKVQKTGGLTKDSSAYVIFEDDSLPEAGNYYLFSVKFSEGDDFYVASGINTSALIDDVNITDNTTNSQNSITKDSQSLEVTNSLESSAIYQKYEEAYQNEIPFTL